MKKITFLFLMVFIAPSCFSQTYSTGIISLYNNDNVVYTAKIDVTNTLVTLTLSGPDKRYLAFGFGVQSMLTQGDVVIFYDDPETTEVDFQLSDRTFNASYSEPLVDSHQDWTIVSNSLLNGQRQVVATRALNTGHDGDYVFSTTDTSLDYSWALGNSYMLQHHSNRGASMQAFTLSQEDMELDEFKMTPNPARSQFELRLPPNVTNMRVTIYDVLGKKVFSKLLQASATPIDISKWNNGVYLVRLTSDKITQTKRLVKQ